MTNKTCTLLVFLASVLATDLHAAHPARESFVPTASRGEGSNGSLWRSDLFINNPNPSEATIDLYWLERNSPNNEPKSVHLTLPAYRSRALDDFILTSFGLEKGYGGVRIVATLPVVASARIYTTGTGGSFGQEISALPPSAGIGTSGITLNGRETSIGGVNFNRETRINMWSVSSSTITSNFDLVIEDATGHMVFSKHYGSTGFTPLLDRLDNYLSGKTLPNATVRFVATSGEALVGLSVVDNQSNDPSTREPAWPFLPADPSGLYLGNVSFAVPAAMQVVVAQSPTGPVLKSISMGGVLTSPEDGGSGCANSFRWVDDAINIPLDKLGQFQGSKKISISDGKGHSSDLTYSWTGRLHGTTITGRVDLVIDPNSGGGCSGHINAQAFELVGPSTALR